MNRKLFLQTIGGIAALIPALRAKAAKPEVTSLNVDPLDGQHGNYYLEKSPEPESFKTWVQLSAEEVSITPQFLEVGGTLKGQRFRVADSNSITIKGINEYQKLSGNLGTRNVNYEVQLPKGKIRFTGQMTDYIGNIDYTVEFEAGQVSFIQDIK